MKTRFAIVPLLGVVAGLPRVSLAQAPAPYTLCSPADFAGRPVGTVCTTIHELYWRYVGYVADQFGGKVTNRYTPSVRYTNVFLNSPFHMLRLRWRQSPQLSGEIDFTGAGYHEADFGNPELGSVDQGTTGPPPLPISFTIFGFYTDWAEFAGDFGAEPEVYGSSCDDSSSPCLDGPNAPDPLYPPATVPEPMTVLLLGTGLLGVGAVGLVRRRAT